MAAHSKKTLLWLRLKVTLLYEYRHKHLGDSLTTCPLIKTMVLRLPCGPWSSHSWFGQVCISRHEIWFDVEQIKSKEVFGCNQISHTTTTSIHIPCPESQYCSIWGPVLGNSIGDPSTPSLHSLAPWKLARTEEVSRLFPAWFLRVLQWKSVM